MIVIRASLALSCFLCGLSQAPLLSQSLSEPLVEKYKSDILPLGIDSEKLACIQVPSAAIPHPAKIALSGNQSAETSTLSRQLVKNMRKPTSSLFSKLSAKPADSVEPKPVLINPHLHMQDVLKNQCRKEPMGVGVPGFQPGTPRSLVRNMFGSPSKTLSGYWPNTTALVYDLIPEQISLGFLFDRDSELLRQTEVSFSDSVESRVVLLTLNSLLGCRINEDIKQGLQQVRQRESRRYSFSLESIEGVIERDERGRVYIGIWEADLH